MIHDPLEHVLHLLKRSTRVLITTHVRPDGDALGSSAALALGLKARGIEAEIFLLSKVPSKFEFLVEGLTYRVCFDQPPPSDYVEKFDTLLVVDTGTWSQLPHVEKAIAGQNLKVLVIDHHRTQEPWGDARWVNPGAAAAGEMVAQLLRAWDVGFDTRIVESIFVAIATDTGWFQFSNTTPTTLRLVADLMEAGLDTDRLYQLLYQNEKPERLQVQRRAMKSLTTEAGGRVAIMSLSRTDFEQIGAGVLDTENIVNIPLQVRDIQASALIVEQLEGGPLRVSFRSKGGLDVAKFAEQFGGGGHARASGAKIAGSVDDVRRRLVIAFEQSMGG